MLADENTPENMTEQSVFVLNGITYLPHYSKRFKFVYPGYTGKGTKQPLIDIQELINAGATVKKMFLWARKRS